MSATDALFAKVFADRSAVPACAAAALLPEGRRETPRAAADA